MTSTTEQHLANYAHADALLLRWNKAHGAIHAAQLEFKAIIDEYESLEDEVKPEEKELFEERLDVMRDIDLDKFESDYLLLFDITFPLDIDNRFPEVDSLATPPKKTRKRKSLVAETPAA